MSMKVEAGSPSLSPAQVTQPPLSPKEIANKVASLDAISIEYIAKKVGWNAMAGLGTFGKGCIAHQIVYHASTDTGEGKRQMKRALDDINSVSATKYNEGNYFSGQFDTLWRAIVTIFRDEITTSLSTPQKLLDEGLSFRISEGCKPTEQIKTVAKNVGINVNEAGRDYCFNLKLKAEQKKPDLVFVLNAIGDGVVFEQSDFTLQN